MTTMTLTPAAVAAGCHHRDLAGWPAEPEPRPLRLDRTPRGPECDRPATDAALPSIKEETMPKFEFAAYTQRTFYEAEAATA